MNQKRKTFRAVVLGAVCLFCVIALIVTVKIEPADRGAGSSVPLSGDFTPSSQAILSQVASVEVGNRPIRSDLTSSGTSSRLTEGDKGVSSAAAESKATTSASRPTVTASRAATQSSAASDVTVSAAQPPATFSCTVEIRCDTVLQNWDRLKEEKKPYVPSDGVILEKITISCNAGDTAFDLLTRVARQYNIPTEHRMDDFFGTVYIEGIGHLYEKDCGDGSGWMYLVNGKFPNYGCGSYLVQPNDHILLCYTCNVGKDVGDPYWDTH